MKRIDYEVIDKNIKEISKTNNISLVLKNDAYGFKMDKIIPIAINNGISTFYVNTIFEAIRCRMMSNAKIILLGPGREYLVNIIKYNILPTAINEDDILFYTNNKIKFALEIDTGMNRFGIKEYSDETFNNEYIEEVYAHFYKSLSSNRDIMDRIHYLCDKYKKSFSFGGSLTYGISNYPLRVGRIIYEGSMSFYGRVLEIKRVNKGETIGYEAEYKAKENITIAVLDIGYYNGLKVNFKGRLFLKGKYYKAVGRVCMNHMFVLVDEMVNVGDALELFGDNISLDEFIVSNNMSKYESFLSIK